MRPDITSMKYAEGSGQNTMPRGKSVSGRLALLDTTHTNLAGLLWPIENIGSTYEEYEMDSSRLTQRILEAFEAELEDLERELDSYEIGRP